MVSELSGVNITKSVIIIDLKGVTLLTNNTELISTFKTISYISA